MVKCIMRSQTIRSKTVYQGQIMIRPNRIIIYYNTL